ncbi:TPA: hypothetical protein ACU8BU_001939 [Neisseria subflava]|jgi:hypothetical protein
MYFNPNGSGPTPGAVAAIATSEYRTGMRQGYKKAQEELQAEIDAAYNRGYDAGWKNGDGHGWNEAVAKGKAIIQEKEKEILRLKAIMVLHGIKVEI